MTSPTDRIAEVQAAHRWATIPGGAWAAGRYICSGCEVISKTLSGHEAHVAEQIAKALQPEQNRQLGEAWQAGYREAKRR